MQDLNTEIRDIIAVIIEKKPEEITPDARFFEDLGVDSMMALEILAAIEKKYKISIPEEKLAQLTTLNQTIAVAKEYMSQTNG
ncbi:MAG: acyl carrier protein [Candidatus Omnitrophota bacterium]|nr:acyl carrier protein [Candidatus Omnitrophota bacterium]